MEQQYKVTDLESLLQMADELGHLNDLMLKRASDLKGASAEKITEEVITPVLNSLETHLKSNLHSESDPDEIKSCIHGWIEEQLSL